MVGPLRRVARAKQLVRCFLHYQKAHKVILARRAAAQKRQAAAARSELGRQKSPLGDLSDISSAISTLESEGSSPHPSDQSSSHASDDALSSIWSSLESSKSSSNEDSTDLDLGS